ncbi:outer membrane protein [Parasulfitobacter algicola]|uniref:Porin family protein n=1 Tax=Parasulfitobacter algicola TaxID=2614809 RepID=A0ABX2J0Q9_9RHOB|nr:outer membrane beta-barrel protein [Sulfitobacter algicola]NSX56781.1 porin family protein [Sulfitobacter algicola]
MKLKQLILLMPFCILAAPLKAQDWDGWHGGLHIGGAEANGEHDIKEDGLEFLDEPVGLDDISGGLGGIRIGYDWTKNQTLFGIEAEISSTDINDRFTNDVVSTGGGGFNDFDFYETSIESMGSIRGRIGRVVGKEQRTLIYGLGGLAIADVNAKNGDADPRSGGGSVRPDCGVSGGCAEGDETAFGFTIGAGVEHQFKDLKIGRGALSLGLEYAYYDFGEVEFKTRTDDLTPADHEFDVDLSAHTLQAVIRLRF